MTKNIFLANIPRITEKSFFLSNPHKTLINGCQMVQLGRSIYYPVQVYSFMYKDEAYGVSISVVKCEFTVHLN